MARLTRAKKDRRLAQLRSGIESVSDAVLSDLGLGSSELELFQEKLEGRIVLPGMPEYEKDRRGNSMYPVLDAPQMIVYCEVTTDVRWCLEVARENSMPFTVRSGGHSTAGFSVNAGMVIDMSEMNGVGVNTDLKQARVQAGAGLGKLYAELEAVGLHVPGGECDTVGVAGHMSGGGYGFTTREFGLNCDVVQQIWMMLANGGIVRANKNQNADLFWAVRGGTGNNFGALLEIQYGLAELGPLWGFCLRWPIDEAPPVLVELQSNFMRAGATRKLGYQLTFATIDGAPGFVMMGMFDGTRDDGMAALKPIFEMSSPKVTFDDMGQYKELNSELINGWFNMPPEPGTYEVKTCAYIDRPLGIEGWQTIIDFFKTAPNPFNIAAMEVYGGRVSEIPVSECAFIHRNVDVDLFMDSFCNENWQYNDLREAERWLADLAAVVARFSNGHKYQNYPERNEPDYRWAYWGDAYPSLLYVKEKYDPHNFFRFPQSIGGYGEDVRRSDAPSIFSDPEIIYEPYGRPG